jgi:hypothetical protein
VRPLDAWAISRPQGPQLREHATPWGTTVQHGGVNSPEAAQQLAEERRPALLAFASALDSASSTLRRDECGDRAPIGRGASPVLNQAGLENILGNDTLGDCVEAGCGHIEDIWRADALTGGSLTAAQTIAFYSATSGYVPGDPNTDQGSDEVTVANYWLKNGFVPGLSPIAGYVSVDPTNVTQLNQASTVLSWPPTSSLLRRLHSGSDRHPTAQGLCSFALRR